jgi:hypothetical protein
MNFTSLTDIKSKWVSKELNVKAKSIKLLEGNIGVIPYDHLVGNSFLNMTPKA